MNNYLKYYIGFLFLVLAHVGEAQTRYIKTVEPVKGYAGQLVNIKGAGFASGDRVFFGSMEGTVLSASNQLIEAEVPAGATFDNITVLHGANKLTYYSNDRFLPSFGGEEGLSASDFDAQVDIAAESGLYDVCVSDLDSDQKNDVIGANSKSNSITLLRNQSTPGNISFSKIPLNVGGTTLNVTAGDLTGDGKPELVFTEGSDGDKIFILVNNSSPGSLSFVVQSLNINNASTKRVVIRDMDLDGKPDLIVSDQTNNKIYLVRNISSGGTLAFDGNITTITVANASSTAGLEVEDLNGDRRPEIITNQFLTDGGGFYVATNQSTAGSFAFSSFTQFDSPGTFVNLKVADLNGDDKPDIAATLFLSTATAVFINQSANGGAVSFGSAQNLSTDQRPWGLDIGDMDGDGKKDIVVGTIGSSLAVDVLHNNSSSGSLSFPKVSIPVTYINRNIKVADIDGDSKPDIVFASVDDESNGITASKISILRNKRCVTPIINPEGPITTCTGNPAHLEAQKVAGATYEWRQDGTIVKTGSDNFIDATATGDYTVTIIMEGGSCSKESEAVTVTVVAAGALPSPTITTNSPVCTAGTLTLTASDVGATTYQWRGPEGFSATGLSVSVNNFSFAKTGRYYLDVYAGTCIIETKSVVVQAITAPDFFVNQSGTGTYCTGDAVTLSVTPNDPNFTYQWYKDAAAISGATGATYSPSGSGTYYVKASDQVNTTCPAIPSDSVDVNFLSSPQAQFSFPTSSCSGVSIPFTDASVVDNAAQVNYSWNFGDGGTSSDQNPVHTYNAAGTYDVTLSISYAGYACSNQLTQQITVEGGINLTINATSNSVCEGDSVELSVDSTYASYDWSTGETSPSIVVTEKGNYSLTVTNANGCEGSASIAIDVFPTPTVEITSSSNNVSQGDTITLTATGLANYTWAPDSLFLSSTGSEVQAVLLSSAKVYVSGTDANGCTGSDTLEIPVTEQNIGSQLKPMKFFSPNFDGISDDWIIENMDVCQDCGVEIYDQEGNKIYEAMPYENNWEGTSQGKPVPDGVYYFIVKSKSKGIVRSGSITLLR